MTEGAPVLLRVGDENSYKIVRLNKDEVSIGNSDYATYTISSQAVSQFLVVIRRQKESWTLTDIMSSNGIYVNDQHLAVLSPYTLQDGDVVQFGDPASPGGQEVFQYKFCSSFTGENIRGLQNMEEENKDLDQQLTKHNVANIKVEATQPKELEVQKKELEVKKKELEAQRLELERQLRCQRLALEALLVDRQRERESLMAELVECRRLTDEAEQQAREVKDGILANYAELMDATVQCSICTEYFVQATSLNCGHVFCNLCIKEWMHIKRQCPNCRTPTTVLVKIPVLDTFIDRMIGLIGGDIRRRRQELINQRKNNRRQCRCRHHKAANQNGPVHAPVGVLSTLRAWLSVSDRTMAAVAAHLKAVVYAAVVHARPANIRRTVALTRAEVMTQVRALGRSETVRRAAALTKKAVKTGARALAKAKVLTTTKMLAASTILRRAALLTRAAAVSKSKELSKSTIFRHAAALAKLTASTAVNKSTLLRRAAELANASARGSSEVLTKSLVAKRAVALSKAVAQTATVRKAVLISKAAMTRAATLKRAQTLTRLTGLVKAEARRRVVVIKRTAAVIKAYTATGVATVKNTSAVFVRAITIAHAEFQLARNTSRAIAIQPGILHNAAQVP
ncbi:hypothetical protein BsWGS_14855 [Bradybaena similaris]